MTEIKKSTKIINVNEELIIKSNPISELLKKIPDTNKKEPPKSIPPQKKK
jgi:hypothetical protein